MGALEGKVAIVTGGGRGLGRAHAHFLASEGARVLVNDPGRRMDGGGDDRTLAATVADEITAAGGRAEANVDDVTEWASGQHLIRHAVDAFGRLDILVNNAGHLRDRLLVNMSEEEWDTVVDVHLKGHFVALRHAAAYWRARAKAGEEVGASVINTSSTSGLQGNPGQTNYGAAKAAIGALTIIAAQELSRYGVRVNAIVPLARTRLTQATPGLGEMIAAPTEDGRFDEWDPANVSPLVGWLATDRCTVTGRVLAIFGGTIQPMTGWTKEVGISRNERWTIDRIDEELPALLT